MMEQEEKAQLLEVIFEYYNLPFPSSSRKILCPVHDEDNPSAVVNPDTGKWKCFACQQSGDAYDLIQIRENVSFSDAVQFATRVLDASGRDIRGGSGGKSGRGVSGGTRDRRESRRYVPSWLRQA